ncbi:hypothetical protein RI367_007681 [Sorochytrium milnesiophthora]
MHFTLLLALSALLTALANAAAIPSVQQTQPQAVDVSSTMIPLLNQHRSSVPLAFNARLASACLQHANDVAARSGVPSSEPQPLAVEGFPAALAIETHGGQSPAEVAEEMQQKLASIPLGTDMAAVRVMSQHTGDSVWVACLGSGQQQPQLEVNTDTAKQQITVRVNGERGRRRHFARGVINARYSLARPFPNPAYYVQPNSQ